MDGSNFSNNYTCGLYYPGAITELEPAYTKGYYNNDYPKGCVIHYTAGNYLSFEDEVKWQKLNKYCYIIINEHGEVAQNFPINKWGYHAGQSYWPYDRILHAVSNKLVGIEVQCAGKLTEKNGSYYTWWGKKVNEENINFYNNYNRNIEKGAYHAFNEKQILSLKKLVNWLINNNPNVFKLRNVVGHDEVSPGRKSDPGGSLGMTMDAFRESLGFRGFEY